MRRAPTKGSEVGSCAAGIGAAGQAAAGSAVVGDGGRFVAASPPSQLKPPTEIYVLLVEEHRLIEILSPALDVIEGGAPEEHGCTPDAEEFSRSDVLSRVRLAFAAVEGASTFAHAHASAVDGGHREVGGEVITEQSATGTAGFGAVIEDPRELCHEGRGDEEVVVGDEDERSRARPDAEVRGAGIASVAPRFDDPDPLPATRPHEPGQTLARVVVDEDDLQVDAFAREEGRDAPLEQVQVAIGGNDGSHGRHSGRCPRGNSVPCYPIPDYHEVEQADAGDGGWMAESRDDPGSPGLTIVIVAYQVQELVAECLRSIDIAAEGLDVSVHLIENGSDGTAAMVREAFPGVTVHEPGCNLGFPAACNLVLGPVATAEESTPYVLLLNPDTLVEPETLSVMLRFMEAHPEAGAATCRVELAAGGLDWACHRGFPTPWAAFTHYSGLERLFPKSHRFGGYHLSWQDLDSTHEIDTPTGAFFLARSAALREVGAFDERFFMYGEDIDLAFRLKAKGWKVYYHPAARIVHHKGASSGLKRASAQRSQADLAQRLRSNQYFGRAMRMFYDKHYAASDPALVRLAVRGTIGLRTLVMAARFRAARMLGRG